MPNPLVSIIVVTHNDEALIGDCLSALGRMDYRPYEVIVVDNASTDATLKVLSESAPEVKVIANSVGGGPGRGNNQGAAIAGGELLVFLNPDVIVSPEWLTILVRHLSEHPDIGIICPSVLRPGEPPRDSAMALGEQASVPGCSMMVSRTAWDSLQGFDESFFLYWEDTDLCWRAWLLGWRVVEDFDAHVWHHEGGSTAGRSWAAQQIRNGLYTHLKLMPWGRVGRFAVTMVAKTLVALPRAPKRELIGAWTWNLKHLRTTLRLRRRWAEPRRRHAETMGRRVAAHARRQWRERRELRGA